MTAFINFHVLDNGLACACSYLNVNNAIYYLILNEDMLLSWCA
jgi:hypothetical protein